MSASNTWTMSRAATVGGLVVGALGIAILWAAGVQFPVAIPPGIIILLTGALFVSLAPWRWSPAVGALFGLFVTVGFLISPTGLNNLTGDAGLAVAIGQAVQQIGVITALVAGVIATRDAYRGRVSRSGPSTDPQADNTATDHPDLAGRGLPRRHVGNDRVLTLTRRWNAIGEIWTRGRRVERVCYALGAVLVGVGLLHLAVFAIDGGPWYGPVSWRKPTTFGLSFGLTLITVTWVASYLPISERLRAPLLGAFAADCFVEVGGITLQAWRHVPSHVNRATPFDSAVSTVLAVGGGVLVVVLAALAVAAFRRNPRVPASMRLALRAGFATLVIGLATGAAMIARGVVEVNNGHQQEAYQVVGFLKPVHGVSLHGVLVLPALAWFLSFTAWEETRRIRVVTIATIGYGLAIAVALAYSLLR